MAQFIQRYGAEAKCYRALYRARWPKGFRCPKCDQRSRSRFRRAGQVYYQCRACRHQTTLTSGTVPLEHPTFAVIEPVRAFDNVSLTDWGRRRLVPGRCGSL